MEDMLTVGREVVHTTMKDGQGRAILNGTRWMWN